MTLLLSVTLASLVFSPAFASITCLKVGATATAKWTNAADEHCTWTGLVGSNFGIDPVTKGKYVQLSSDNEVIFLLISALSSSYSCNGR